MMATLSPMPGGGDIGVMDVVEKRDLCRAVVLLVDGVQRFAGLVKVWRQEAADLGIAVMVGVYVPAIDDDGISDVGHGDVAEVDIFHNAAQAAERAAVEDGRARPSGAGRWSVPLKVQFLTVRPSSPALVCPPTEMPWPWPMVQFVMSDVAAIGAEGLATMLSSPSSIVAVLDEEWLPE